MLAMPLLMQPRRFLAFSEARAGAGSHSVPAHKDHSVSAHSTSPARQFSTSTTARGFSLTDIGLLHLPLLNFIRLLLGCPRSFWMIALPMLYQLPASVRCYLSADFMCAPQHFLHSLIEMLNWSYNTKNPFSIHLQRVQLVYHHTVSPVIQNFIPLTDYTSFTYKDHNFLTYVQEYCRRQYQKPWWRWGKWYSMVSLHLGSQPF